jgi:predicted dehydrogenase
LIQNDHDPFLPERKLMQPVKVGLIGCGNISTHYVKTLRVFPITQLTACADIDFERAQSWADQHGVSKAYTVDQLLADPSIDLVVNLTIPNAHCAITMAALEANKHVHSEKPLCLTYADARKLVETARSRNLRLGCAPDTFLGGGFQTCRKLIDDGWIGRPIGAAAFLLNHGHEHWHPDPEFYYKEGGGPMLDMGPYYLATLVSLLGPIRRVSGVAGKSFEERTITSEPKRGAKVSVDVPTYIAGTMEFENGVIGSLITTFDVWASNLPHLEIYGSEGSLSMPDPNWFRGPVRVKRHDAADWSEVPLTHGFTADHLRGLGAVDMAHALRSGRPHRANGEMALHVVEAMTGFMESAQSGRTYELHSCCKRPAAVPVGLPDDRMD